MNNSSLLFGGTVGVTGGTAKTFKIDGQKVNNGIHLVETAPADYRLADGVIATAKQSVYNNSTGEFSKFARSTKLIRPVILASGKLVFRSVLVSIEDHPEISAADQLELRYDGLLLGFDSDYSDLWTIGTLE
jgi:hypothetical protein